jgi:hypothetical protein
VNVNENVGNVMTRNPLSVSPDISVLEALETMHSERFLTLPVCEEDGTVVGIVDVMDVIYGCGGADGWRSIFSSAMDMDCDGTASVGHRSAKASVTGTSILGKATRSKTPSVAAFVSDLPGNIPLVLEFKDDDHVSFTGSTIGEERIAAKSIAFSNPEDVSMANSAAGATYKITCPNGSTHRIRCEPKVEDLFDAITEKTRISRNRLRVEYEDDEGDVVVITTDDDVIEAWNVARKTGKQVAKLSIVERGKSFDQNPAVFVGAGITAVALLGVLTFTLLRQSK